MLKLNINRSFVLKSVENLNYRILETQNVRK